MEVSLLDTNLILDDYFPKRKRHNEMKKFVQTFKYGDLSYMNSVGRECIDVISKALADCSLVLNNLILRKHKGSKSWDETDPNLRRETVKDAIVQLKSKPGDFEKNLDLIITFLDLNREWITAVQEQELRGFMMAIVPNAVADFSGYISGRYSLRTPLYPNGDGKEMEGIKSFLLKFIPKPYNSYDLTIAVDILVLAVHGESNGEKYSRISFFTADEDFLSNLGKAKEGFDQGQISELNFDPKCLYFENPYESKSSLNVPTS